jgi:hypothetical protein
MQTLTNLLGLNFQDLIRVRVSAQNALGLGPSSDINTTGASIRRKPDKMQNVFLGTNNNETTLELKWFALSGAQTGNSALQYYELYWDSNTGLPNILLKQGLVSSFIQAGLQPG